MFDINVKYYCTIKRTAARPQLRILHREGFDDCDEIMADALSVRGFENYGCSNYHLGTCALKG